MVVERGCTSSRGRNEKKVCEWEEVVRVRPVWIELFCFSIDYISCGLFSSLGWNATGLFFYQPSNLSIRSHLTKVKETYLLPVL